MQSLPPLRGPAPFAPDLPPLRAASFLPPGFPPLRGLPQAPLRPPPLRRLPPLRPALPRCYADPRSASRRSGIAAPASATAPPLTRLGAACAGGGCPRRWRGCGWNSLAVRSLASASGVALGGHAGLCPSGKAARVKIGGVLRGVLPRSSALRASGGGARGNAVRGSSPRAQPRLRSALGLRPRLRASFKSAEDGGFPTPLVRPRLSRPFFGLISALWGL